MSWSKPEIVAVECPKPLVYWRWIVFFIVLLLATGSSLIFFWSDDGYFRQFLFWFLLVLIPIVIGAGALSIRFYLYGLEQERYDIWQQERININDNWQEWAMQFVYVLDSYVLTPNEINVKKILFERKDMPVQVDQLLAFNEDISSKQYLEELLSTMKDSLFSLPDNLSLDIFIYSSLEAYGSFDDDFRAIYQTLGFKQNYTLTHQVANKLEVNNLIELVDGSKSSLQLVIANNLLSQNSAFLSAVLLMDKIVYSELNIDIAKAQIFRPMVTDDIVQGIEQMVDMQPVIHDIKQLWLTNLDNEQETDIIQQLGEYQVSLDNLYFLASLIGKQSLFSYWLALALGCEIIPTTQLSALVASSCQGEILCSVITKVGVENEK